MHIIFLNYGGFNSPSAMHVFHLANALADQGVRCSVYSYNDAGQAESFGKPKFRALSRSSTPPRRLAAELAAKGEDCVLHSWTPRDTARDLTMSLLKAHSFPYVVHMEDNEEAIYAAMIRHLPAEIVADPASSEPGGVLYGFSHPVRYREFIAGAKGYTCIIESLLDFKPEHVPGHVFFPACEETVFALPPRPTPQDKERWGIPGDCATFFYPGNVHLNNADEVLALYCAIGLLRKRGVNARIIKFGHYIQDIPEAVFSRMECRDALVDLTGRITQADVPEVMRAADILIQPGCDNPFNRYRFPCKLPLFLASGRPVILPDSNLGKRLKHGENCLLLREGATEEILANILFLLRNPDKAAAIGIAGRAFAEEHFSWEKSAAGLKDFYREVLE
ncbi:MAG: glycosyltransferase family 4 protein [Desulfovibrio sp.]|jgi:glycosyltransferase involved in cell wall biosynthesis|nr:glycosyltransferase family 4 protein [Desulfovibrio sp.]